MRTRMVYTTIPFTGWRIVYYPYPIDQTSFFTGGGSTNPFLLHLMSFNNLLYFITRYSKRRAVFPLSRLRAKRTIFETAPYKLIMISWSLLFFVQSVFTALAGGIPASVAGRSWSEDVIRIVCISDTHSLETYMATF